MTALAEGTAGLSLVMGFALLCIRQLGAAAILLWVQSAAVATSAVVLHQPVMALPPLLLATGIWALSHRIPAPEPQTAPTGGAKLGIAVGAALAVLCQSVSALALPLAVILLSVLLATTRRHRLMQVMALVGIQNGIVLAACMSPLATGLAATILPVACLLLPLPLAAGILFPNLTQRGRKAPAPPHRHGPLPNRHGPACPGHLCRLGAATGALARVLARPDKPGHDGGGERGHDGGDERGHDGGGERGPIRLFSGAALGWIDVILSFSVFVATFLVPLDPTASIFAPLLGLDLVLRSWRRRTRQTLSPSARGLVFLASVFPILAVCPPNPIIAWIAVLACIAASLFPTLTRRWNDTVLASVGAGLALFGLLLVTQSASIPGFFSILAGFAAIASVVPDLAVVLVILLLRLTTQTPWPPDAEALGIAIALAALLACAAILHSRSARPPIALLQLSQAAIATLALSVGGADGRFAALVLLILLILSRSAATIARGPVRSLAIAGLTGIPPLGVFPGLVLVVLVLAGHESWLLLPLGAAGIPIILASLPRKLPTIPPRVTIPSPGWLPLALALLTGYFTPDGLVRWWHLLTAGRG
jgi:hypothetical protein